MCIRDSCNIAITKLNVVSVSDIIRNKAVFLSPILSSSISVSYTHLDVYKRQVQRGQPVVLAGDKPAGFIKDGLHGKLVMLKEKISVSYTHLWFHCTTERRGLYSGKSVKFASLQLFNFPIFMVWVVVPYLQ